MTCSSRSGSGIDVVNFAAQRDGGREVLGLGCKGLSRCRGACDGCSCSEAHRMMRYNARLGPKVGVTSRRNVATSLSALLMSLTSRLERGRGREGVRTGGKGHGRCRGACDRSLCSPRCLAEVLTLLASRLESAEAAKVCGPAAKVLTDAMTHEADVDIGWGRVGRRLDVAGRAAGRGGSGEGVLRPGGRGTRALADARVRGAIVAYSTYYPDDFVEGLTSLAARLDAAEAAKVCSPAARVLADALEHAPVSYAQYRVGTSIDVVGRATGRCGSGEGVRPGSKSFGKCFRRTH